MNYRFTLEICIVNFHIRIILKLFLQWGISKSIGKWSWFKAKLTVLFPLKLQSDSGDCLNESVPYSLWASDLYLIAMLLASEPTWYKESYVFYFLVWIFVFFLLCSAPLVKQNKSRAVWYLVTFCTCLKVEKVNIFQSVAEQKCPGVKVVYPTWRAWQK